MTRSSRTSSHTLPRRRTIADPTARFETDLLTGVSRHAEDLRRAASCALNTLPPDLSTLPQPEIARHLEWLIDAACCSPSPSDEPGATMVIRRRLLDLIRAELIRYWTIAPPPAEYMIDTLARLETVRVACVPNLEQSFAAELVDGGGLDLIVEVAHDMRSPLTSILFLSEILHRGQSGPLNDVQKRQVGIMYSAALGLVGMASDMIEVARGGNRLATKTPVSFAVNELLLSIHDLVRPMAEEKGVTFKIHQLSSDHRVGYPVPLSRILLNLATNAMKFTHEGSVQVYARDIGGARVEFSVQDSGPGIPPEALETLYQPFRREASRKTGYYFSGTGLGLAICRRLVTAMGSELVVDTKPEVGSRFSFILHLPPAKRL